MKKDTCFVIMPFSDEMKPVYEDAIKPAAESQNLKCIRVDEISGTGNIIRRIVECIHEAKVVIADLTGKNANVFYELGVSHALGNNVIVLAQDLARDVPFDVSHYKVIQYSMTWSGDRKLKGNIEQAIKSMDEWTARPSNPVQDFLPAEDRPVSQGDYNAIHDDLRKARGELQEAVSEVARLKADENDLTGLREENKRLQWVQQFVRHFFEASAGSSEGMEFDEILARFMERVDREGEVTVSVPRASDSQAAKGQQKIAFRKVSK